MKYYEHRQTMPLYVGDIKLLNGDVMIENNDGSVVVRRNGVTILNLGKGKVEVPQETKVVEPKEEPEEELVVKIDIEPNLDKMNKKEIEEFALKRFDVNLDRRQSKDTLISKVKKLLKGDR